MLKLKTILLGSVVSLSALTMGNLAHADESQDQNQSGTDQAQSGTDQVGVYVEGGGVFDFSNMVDVTTKETNEQIVIKQGGGGAVGIGVRRNNFSAGFEYYGTSPNVDYQDLSVGGSPLFGGSKQAIGYLDMNVFMLKLTPEHNFNDHIAIYGSFGVGAGRYELDASNTKPSDPTNPNQDKVQYSPTYIKPAIMFGIGAKVYLGQDKGLYLSAGVRYTKILNSELTINMTPIEKIKITGGFGFGQGVIKLGYQF